MRISALEASSRWNDLFELAADGDEVIIERNGREFRLALQAHNAPHRVRPWSEKSREERRDLLDQLSGMGNSPADLDRSSGNHDWLYGEDGLPA